MAIDSVSVAVFIVRNDTGGRIIWIFSFGLDDKLVLKG